MSQSFNLINEVVPKPKSMKAHLLEEQLRQQLRKMLGELTTDLAREPDIILYIAIYLENALTGEKKGPLRKQIAMNVLGPYFTSEIEKQNLSKLIDFVVERDMVQKLGCMHMIFRAIKKYTIYKLK